MESSLSVATPLGITREKPDLSALQKEYRGFLLDL
jgi:hypothetical protein